MTAEQGGTYKTYMYKRTYVPRAGDGDPAPQSVELAALPGNAEADQQRTYRPPCGGCRHSIAKSTRRVAGTQPERHRTQCRGLLLRLGEARICGRIPLVGRTQGDVCRPACRKSACWCATHRTPPEPTTQPASRETALAHIANIRKMLNASKNAGDIAAQAMQARGWQPRPA